MDISDHLPIFDKKYPIVRTKRHFDDNVFNDISHKLENTDIGLI